MVSTKTFEVVIRAHRTRRTDRAGGEGTLANVQETEEGGGRSVTCGVGGGEVINYLQRNGPSSTISERNKETKASKNAVRLHRRRANETSGEIPDCSKPNAGKQDNKNTVHVQGIPIQLTKRRRRRISKRY